MGRGRGAEKVCTFIAPVCWKGHEFFTPGTVMGSSSQRYATVRSKDHSLSSGFTLIRGCRVTFTLGLFGIDLLKWWGPKP